MIAPEIGPGADELERSGDRTLLEISFEVDGIAAAADAIRTRGEIPLVLPGQAIECQHPTAQSGNRYSYLPSDGNGGARTEILQATNGGESPSVTPTPPRGEFVGRVAIVTGGASGIGEAIVRGFVAEGGRVAIFDLQQELAEGLATRLGGPGSCIALGVDVTHPVAVRSAVHEVIGSLGTVDIVVNCAGFNRFAEAEAVDDDLWRQLIAINLDGPWNVCSAVMPEMIRRRSGRIVNISSVAGVLGIPKAVPYSSAKHGVVGLTRSLAIDLGQYGITVNCVAPGPTLTPLMAAATSETFKAEATNRAPLGRVGTPGDLASAVLFLASDRASWITGVVLPVDGGTTASIRAHHWE